MNTEPLRTRVAFQGERGAFSETAAIKLLGPEIIVVPRTTFADLFRSLDDGVADLVLTPVENTLIGPIHPAVDLLNETELISRDEITIRIEHHLIGCPGSSLSEIEKVESHPAALAQCKLFFASNPQLEPIQSQDTAGSVADVISAGDCRRAAIAGQTAAYIHGGVILKNNIEDSPNNHTRFLLLSK